MKPCISVVLATLVSLLSPIAAVAADATAEALFRAGREAAEKGDFELACQRFAESQRLEPAIGTVFNLAHCREKLGQVASAWRLYTEVKDRLPASDKRAAFAQARVRALEKRLPRLTLELSPEAEGATVLRDGIELRGATLGLALPVDPGAHEIVVRMEGRADESVTVDIAEGEEKTVVLDPGPIVASAAEPGAPGDEGTPATTEPSPVGGDEAAGDSRRTIGFVIGGIGAAGIVTSLVTGALVLSKKDIVERECDAKVCSRRGVEAGDSGKTLSTVSTVAFAVGVAGLGLGTYFVLSSKDGEEVARVEARASPHAASIQLGGRF